MPSDPIGAIAAIGSPGLRGTLRRAPTSGVVDVGDAYTQTTPNTFLDPLIETGENASVLLLTVGLSKRSYPGAPVHNQRILIVTRRRSLSPLTSTPHAAAARRLTVPVPDSHSLRQRLVLLDKLPPRPDPVIDPNPDPETDPSSDVFRLSELPQPVFMMGEIPTPPVSDDSTPMVLIVGPGPVAPPSIPHDAPQLALVTSAMMTDDDPMRAWDEESPTGIRLRLARFAQRSITPTDDVDDHFLRHVAEEVVGKQADKRLRFTTTRVVQAFCALQCAHRERRTAVTTYLTRCLRAFMKNTWLPGDGRFETISRSRLLKEANLIYDEIVFTILSMVDRSIHDQLILDDALPKWQSSCFFSWPHGPQKGLVLVFRRHSDGRPYVVALQSRHAYGRLKKRRAQHAFRHAAPIRRIHH